MIIYLHMHKCAGTSVIRSAQASGLRLPAVHQNGNLLDDQGKPLKYRGMPHDKLAELLQHHCQDGVEFMAMEWDFPGIEAFDAVPGLRLFTSLRDPVARAISNFKMDKVAGWIAPGMAFADYINGDALYRSDNYYIKMLCQLWPKDSVTDAHFDYAMHGLARFEGVIVVEQSNMARVLSGFGIDPLPRRFNRFKSQAAREALGDDRCLDVSPRDIREFIGRNTLDYALYRHVTRSIRLSAPLATQDHTAWPPRHAAV